MHIIMRNQSRAPYYQHTENTGHPKYGTRRRAAVFTEKETAEKVAKHLQHITGQMHTIVQAAQ